jgi:DNA-directed RNA polymerase specialized sigma subunit
MKFDDLYKDYAQRIKIMSKKYNLIGKVPIPDLISHLNEALWEAYSSFDPDRGCTLDTWVIRNLNNKAIDVLRGKEGNYYNRVFAKLDCPMKDDIDEDAATSKIEYITDISAEDCVIEKKKKADQISLIDFFQRSCKTDATTTAIVEAFLLAPASASPNAISKSIGLHHETVKRKLTALSRRYDANRFGDISDYLAV